MPGRSPKDYSTETWYYRADSVGDSDENLNNDEVEYSKGADDWDFASRYRDIQRYGYLQPKQKLEMSERAISGVLERAHEMLGPIQKPYVYEHWTEDDLAAHARAAQNFTAELDVEETLSNLQLDQEGKVVPTPIYQVRYPLHHGLVLVIDTSLSMKGEKLAFLAATVAAVALSVPTECLAMVGFDSEVHVIKKFDEQAEVTEWISRVLSIPPGGFTHMELGLNTARGWIEGSAYPQARVILISDGRVTEGKDPVTVVRGHSFIHTIKIGKDPHGRKIMREIADEASGNFHEVREMSELPQVLLSAIRTWVR